jgi:hypothetical protein
VKTRRNFLRGSVAVVAIAPLTGCEFFAGYRPVECDEMNPAACDKPEHERKEPKNFDPPDGGGSGGEDDDDDTDPDDDDTDPDDDDTGDDDDDNKGDDDDDNCPKDGSNKPY